jgi:hypothetical protein
MDAGNNIYYFSFAHDTLSSYCSGFPEIKNWNVQQGIK